MRSCKKTELTRHTLIQSLLNSGRIDDFKINPQLFMSAVTKGIKSALHLLVTEDIQYEKIDSHCGEISRIEKDSEQGMVHYLNSLYRVQNQHKSLYDAVEFDSNIEERFARDLAHNEQVKLFVKLPPWFKIDTLIGPYNPDGAFVTERDEKLYFVHGTKSTLDSDERKLKEN